MGMMRCEVGGAWCEVRGGRWCGLCRCSKSGRGREAVSCRSCKKLWELVVMQWGAQSGWGMRREVQGARCECEGHRALLPILLEQEQIISGGALEREQRAALAARCAASLSLSRWWGGQSHSAGSQVRSHSHLLLGRPTHPVLDYRPTRPAPAPSEPRAPPAACCPPAPFSRHCHRAGFRSTSSAPVPLGHYFRPSERHPPEEAPEILCSGMRGSFRAVVAVPPFGAHCACPAALEAHLGIKPLRGCS